MTRLLAIVERELRKFFRSPSLMLTAMVAPLIQLVILGNAFGGKITDARVGVVDYDGGPQALRIHEAFDSVAANIRTFRTIRYDSDKKAQEDVRSGRLDAAVVIPPQFSRRALSGENPSIGFVVDNSDQFLSGSLTAEMQALTDALNRPRVDQRVVNTVALRIVELYPFVEYMKYLLPGSITLAMFVSVMIGGGMLYIDDKARGVHEGFLVTPITRLELVLGLVASGAIKAILAGVVLTLLGSLIAGMDVVFHPALLLQLLLMIVATSFAFNSLMFLLMVRVEDPLVPRAMFGVLNTLLYFPSGAIYPIAAFPGWLRAIARVDPFTYAVHGFKAVLLKDAGFAALAPDLLYLGLIGTLALVLATRLFKRTL
ncbi:ABC transporter permease [Mesoterricola silvestris]|uniref:Transport permease protein n=1 Tax=Mesoterricola silvestris TaxID=2927979 RepID=A0AA48KB33_9BACT|nr:ABC transporter permease [Mesoterricola silvestris]BDU73927.1 transport permease protein [Mesoterricola silvestris]